jgi:hypothetical protein
VVHYRTTSLMWHGNLDLVHASALANMANKLKNG